MHLLHSWGFSPFFQQQLSADEILARVAAEHRDGYVVWTTAGESFARLSGRLIRELQDETYPGVGDWVTLRTLPQADETIIIDGLLNRRTVFMRGAAGQQTRGQIIAANIDIVFAVSGLDADYSVRRIERYLARIWASGAEPIVILNKADVCDDLDFRIAEVEAISPGLTVITTSAKKSEGLDTITQHLRPGTTGALVGSSGAGKSTLINALLGQERFATTDVREDDSRGRHTTTHRQLVLLPSGGLLVDTPGMRELALYDDEGIDMVFSDIDAMAVECRFKDCSHQGEPGCAVRDAVDRGEIPAERLEHYLKLRAEAQSFEIRQDERLRRKGERAFSKRIASDSKLIRKLKEGQ